MSVCDNDIEKVPAASHAKLNGSLAYDAQMYKVEFRNYLKTTHSGTTDEITARFSGFPLSRE